MDPGFEERARLRRERMVGGVAHSHDDLDAADWDYWRGVGASDKLSAIRQLALDAFGLHSRNDASPGPEGPAFGIRRHER
jgi:hypothetical protein